MTDISVTNCTPSLVRRLAPIATFPLYRNDSVIPPDPPNPMENTTTRLVPANFREKESNAFVGADFGGRANATHIKNRSKSVKAGFLPIIWP